MTFSRKPYSISYAKCLIQRSCLGVISFLTCRGNGRAWRRGQLISTTMGGDRPMALWPRKSHECQRAHVLDKSLFFSGISPPPVPVPFRVKLARTSRKQERSARRVAPCERHNSPPCIGKARARSGKGLPSPLAPRFLGRMPSSPTNST